jgi:hypothetical protein
MAEGDVEFTKPNVLLDLERRQALESGESDPTVGEPRNWQVEGNETDAFIGVDPEYQNYADVAGQPFSTSEGAEAAVEQKVSEFQAADKTNVTTDATTDTKPAPEPAPETTASTRRRTAAPE